MDWVVETVPWAIVALLMTLAALSLPWRRQRTFTIRQVVPATREDVWSVYKFDPANPRSAAVYPNIVEHRCLGGEPLVEEFVIDGSRGHRTQMLTLRGEVLHETPGERNATRLVRIGERPYPFGREHVADIAFADHADGTLATMTWQGETLTLWQYLMLRIGTAGYLGRLAKYSAPDAKLPATGGRRRPWANLALTALAVASFVLWFGWQGAGLIVGTLVVHEFGHWLAFRVTGHPAPRVVLIPFLGGAALGNHPHRTQLDAAFVALMGPAFSVVPLALLLGTLWLLVPWVFSGAVDGWAHLLRHFPEPERYGRDIARAIFILSVVNLLQLLPILPLDGGHVLRAAMQSAGARAARWTVMGFAAAGMAGALWLGDYILAAVGGLGLAGAWHMDGGPTEVRPIGRAGLAVIGLGYLATAAVHMAAIHFSLRAFDIAIGF